jgi:hypothetical protein
VGSRLIRRRELPHCFGPYSPLVLSQKEPNGFSKSDWANPVLTEKTVANQLLAGHLSEMPVLRPSAEDIGLAEVSQVESKFAIRVSSIREWKFPDIRVSSQLFAICCIVVTYRRVSSPILQFDGKWRFSPKARGAL